MRIGPLSRFLPAGFLLRASVFAFFESVKPSTSSASDPSFSAPISKVSSSFSFMGGTACSSTASSFARRSCAFPSISKSSSTSSGSSSCVFVFSSVSIILLISDRSNFSVDSNCISDASSSEASAISSSISNSSSSSS